MSDVAQRNGYSYEIVDLPYEAVSVADFRVLLGAYVSAGKYYKFGKSVAGGVDELQNYHTEIARECPTTRWVLAGYSQGAMVVSHAMSAFEPDSVLYIGLLGDPELYLPEGKGIWPDACRGRSLSSYRVYAPNCRTDNGVLGERIPYELERLRFRYGTWCNSDDYICGSSASPLRNHGHSEYDEVAIAWMSVLVERRLPKRWSLSNDTVGKSFRKTTQGVYALFPTDRYYIESGDVVAFDASDSFSLNGEIVRYEWREGDAWVEGGPILWKSYQEDGLIAVRVTDEQGVSAIAEASVSLSAPPELKLPAPRLEIVRTADGKVVAKAIERPSWAKYLLVRLNGFDLGYVEADKTLTIGDLRFTDEEQLTFAWLDEDYNVGEEYDTRANELVETELTQDEASAEDVNVSSPTPTKEKPENISNDSQPVKTGVTSLDWPLAVVVISGALLLSMALFRAKNAHRANDERGDDERAY